MSTQGLSERDLSAITAQLDDIEIAVRVLEQAAGPVERNSVRDIQSPLYGIPSADDLDIVGINATPAISNVMISWEPPPQVLVRFYEVQISERNDFLSFDSFRTTDTRFQYRVPEG